MSLKKLITVITAFLCLNTSIISEEVLGKFNTSWSNVVTGTVICEPVLTSYGFVIATDGRTVCAFTDSGIQIWEKSVSRSKKVSLSVLPGDFILFQDLSSNIITLLNPSGCEIWSTRLDYTPNSKIFPGRDGRFFITGERIIECYGINGIRKWSVQTELQKNDFLQELPDGSLVVFLTENNGKTKGLRISPFGTILEEIVFSGEVVKTYTCSSGILLIFTDGSAGLFSLIQGESKNRWVLNKKNTSSFFAVKDDGNFIYVDYEDKSITVNEVDKDTGIISHSFKIDGIDGKRISKISYSDEGLFIADSKNAVLVNLNGKELWKAVLPELTSRNLWNYIIYTNNGFLVFCQKDWTLNAYRVIQTKLKKNITIKEHKTYSDFYNISQNNIEIRYSKKISKETVSEERLFELRNGDYAEKEIVLSNEITGICNEYSRTLSTNEFGTRKEKTVFELDTQGFEQVLTQLCLFCNSDSQKIAANILEKTKNKTFIKVLLNGIKQNGYDPEGLILNALEKQASVTDYKDNGVISLICDAVYSICVFMGRPAFNQRGKELLKNFLYPSYDAKSRSYARDTLKKIIALDL